MCVVVGGGGLVSVYTYVLYIKGYYNWKLHLLIVDGAHWIYNNICPSTCKQQTTTNNFIKWTVLPSFDCVDEAECSDVADPCFACHSLWILCVLCNISFLFFKNLRHYMKQVYKICTRYLLIIKEESKALRLYLA